MKKNFNDIIKNKRVKSKKNTTEELVQDNGREESKNIKKAKKRSIEVANNTPKSEIVSSREWIVVAGCYEKVLFGYTVAGLTRETVSNPEEIEFLPIFVKVAHDGCIKALTTNGDLLVSASTDESMKIFNLYKRVEEGSLMQHEGIVTTVQFHGKHMLSGSEDGTICIWNIKDWNCLATLRGHKAGVLSLSIHPTGKLAISISKDGTMKLWNLIKGKCAFTLPTEKDSEKVIWAPDGSTFSILANTKVFVYSQSGELKTTLTHTKRVIAMTYLKGNHLLTGGEDNSINIWDTISGKLVQNWEAHKNRVKDIQLLPETDNNIIASISSDGYIKLWKIDLKFKESAKLLTEVSTTARLTCLACSYSRSKEPLGYSTKEPTEDDEEDEEEELEEKEAATKKKRVRFTEQ